MSKDKCIILLSEKSSGSSACQDLLAKFANIRHVRKTRHYEHETLYWTKAASILNKPQLKMVNSEVPIESSQARDDLVRLLKDNVKDPTLPSDDKALIMEGWRMLCEEHSPIFLEKSPHHLCQWSAIELILECMEQSKDVDYLVIGLVRNPMDVIYSQFQRWRSPPEAVQQQWITAYNNLLRLKDLLNDRLVVVRYEDMVTSPQYLQPVFEFCGVTTDVADKSFMHQKSLQKWKKDSFYGFTLSEEGIGLASQFGYHEEELRNESNFLWPAIKNTAITFNTTKQVVKQIFHLGTGETEVRYRHLKARP